MAVKAIGVIHSIAADADPEFIIVEFSMAGVPNAEGLAGNSQTIIPSAPATDVKTAVRDAIKAYMISQGVSFGLFDYVQLL